LNNHITSSKCYDVKILVNYSNRCSHIVTVSELNRRKLNILLSCEEIIMMDLSLDCAGINTAPNLQQEITVVTYEPRYDRVLLGGFWDGDISLIPPPEEFQDILAMTPSQECMDITLRFCKFPPPLHYTDLVIPKLDDITDMDDLIIPPPEQFADVCVPPPKPPKKQICSISCYSFSSTWTQGDVSEADDHISYVSTIYDVTDGFPQLKEIKARRREENRKQIFNDMIDVWLESYRCRKKKESKLKRFKRAVATKFRRLLCIKSNPF